jgi:hypothetical protein
MMVNHQGPLPLLRAKVKKALASRSWLGPSVASNGAKGAILWVVAQPQGGRTDSVGIKVVDHTAWSWVSLQPALQLLAKLR